MAAGAASSLILLGVILWLVLRHQSRADAGLLLAILAVVVIDLAVSGLIIWALKPEPSPRTADEILDRPDPLLRLARPRPVRVSQLGYLALLILIIFCAALGVLWSELTKTPPSPRIVVDRWTVWMSSVVFAAYIIYLPFGLLRSRRLVATGEVSIARVVDWSPGWRGDYATIDFKDLHGVHHRRWTYLVHRPTRPEDLTIFYDRDNPRRFVVDGECAWRLAEAARSGRSWTRRGT